MRVDEIRRGDVLLMSDGRYLVRDVGRSPGHVMLLIADDSADGGDWFLFPNGSDVRTYRPNVETR